MFAILACASAPATAQQPKPPAIHDRAIAAGYKAAMLCSGIFNAAAMGTTRTAHSIEKHELTGIYPEYDALIATLPAVVGKSSVSVSYDPAMPPRIAQSSIAGGCTTLPIGWRESDKYGDIVIRSLHRVGKDWPAGDDRTLATTISPLYPLLDRAFATHYGARSNTTGIVVLYDGKLVAERYAPGFGPRTPQRTWSVAKSIAGTLIGAAAYKGVIDPQAPLAIPQWQRPGDPRRAITLDHLLRMASGLHSATAGNRTDAIYFGGTAVTEEAVAWPLEVQPGTRFRYANNDTVLATLALRTKSAADDLGFANTLLFGPVGMHRTSAEQDWQGNYILSSQVWSTARDLARLGQFWLQDGVWNGQRILPEGWMTYMTSPTGPQPPGDTGYGATLWLHGPKTGLPEGSYAAQGNRGQYIVVVPSAKLVIVRRGEDPAGTGGFEFARFAADVVKALR